MKKHIKYALLAATMACAAPAAAMADDWHHGRGHEWHHEGWRGNYHYAHGPYYYGHPRREVIVTSGYPYPAYYPAPVYVAPPPPSGIFFSW